LTVGGAKGRRFEVEEEAGGAREGKARTGGGVEPSLPSKLKDGILGEGRMYRRWLL